MPRIAYESKRFSGDTLDAIHTANAILEDYANQGYDLTLRQLFYQHVARGEELVQLRVGDPRHTEKALREAREGYEGQYERGTYPEAIDRG